MASSPNTSDGYPIYGAPFNDVTDYGFNNTSLLFPFLQDKQKPIINNTNYYWKCTNTYSLYNNPIIHTYKNTNHQYPLDIIKTSKSDFICHSTGINQNLFTISKLNSLNNNLKLNQIYTNNQLDSIRGISHCFNHNNNETIILSFNSHQIFYYKSINEYKFNEIANNFQPLSCNNSLISCSLCPLPSVFNSGIEDTVFYVSNGSLLFCSNYGTQIQTINLKYDLLPKMNAILWSQHPRIVRFSTDIELLTFDLRIDPTVKCAQKHLYFDPITSINSYKHFLSTVGLQGLNIYDDRMLKKALIKYKFYDFDCLIYSDLQIFPVLNDNNNNNNNEYWIICSGIGRRILIYPFYFRNDGPIVSEMPFNININKDIQIKSLIGYQNNNNNKNKIMITNQFGCILCADIEYDDHANNNIQSIKSDSNSNPKADVVFNWNKHINIDLDLLSQEYISSIGNNKINHLIALFDKYETDIIKFTQIPRTINEIKYKFDDVLIDLRDVSLFDYFYIFKASSIAIDWFQIESVDIHDNDNILDVITTYFVSIEMDDKYLNNKTYNDIYDKSNGNNNNNNIKDELDLDELVLLSKNGAGCSKAKPIILNNNNNTKCDNLLFNLNQEWIDNKDNYIINDWSKQNINNIDYNGMLSNKGSAPKRLHRGLKRVWD